MQFCKKCGTLYSKSLPCCPKCNPELDRQADIESLAPQADKKTIRRQWIAILIAVPTMILLTYLVGGFMQSLGALG